MTLHTTRFVLAALLTASTVSAQRQTQPAPPLQPGQTTDPFPAPIAATEGVITVGVREFASVPDIDGVAARMMNLVNEPGTRRLFVNDMHGPLYSVSYDGKAVTLYLDINAPEWNVRVQSQGSERGFQSFAFHPDFARRGAAGFGKFYTYTDTTNTEPAPDFVPGGGNNTHDMVLLEWIAKDPAAATYDGGAPRELMRIEHPFALLAVTRFRPRRIPGVIGPFDLDDRLVFRAGRFVGLFLLPHVSAAIRGPHQHQRRHRHLLDVLVQARA